MKKQFLLLPFLMIVVLGISYFVFSYFDNLRTKKTQNDSILLNKVDSLINENRRLSEQLSQASQQEEKANTSSLPVTDNTSNTNQPKYAFVLLKVVVDNGYKRIGDNMLPNLELRNVCSQIKSFESYSNDMKYQLMDEFQSHYMTGSIGTTLKSRECFVFDSYEDASKEREKYLIPN